MTKISIILCALIFSCGQDSSQGDPPAVPAKQPELATAPDTGPAGAKGDKGDKGDTGPQGIAGKTVIVSAAMWFDPIEQRYWLTAAYVNYSQAIAACASPWRLPTMAELLLSIDRGATKPTATTWTTDVGTAAGARLALSWNSGVSQFVTQSLTEADPGWTRCIGPKIEAQP